MTNSVYIWSENIVLLKKNKNTITGFFSRNYVKEKGPDTY